MSKFFFFPRPLGVRDPSFDNVEKLRVGLFWLNKLLPGVLHPVPFEPSYNCAAAFLKDDRPLTIFGEAIVRAGDYDFLLLKPDVIFYLCNFFRRKKFIEHGNSSCKRLIIEKYISDETLLIKSLYSEKDISFLWANTLDVNALISYCSDILSLYSKFLPWSELYKPSLFASEIIAMAFDIDAKPASKPAGEASLKGMYESTIRTSSSEI